MSVMKIALANAAEYRLKRAIYKLTDNPLKGLVVGTLATALVQSSSAVTVITVGSVSTGLLSFRQTVGVILGTNIGTTITGEIAALPVGKLHWALLVVGCALLCTARQKAFLAGAFCFGLGCLYTAMHGFTALAEPMEGLAPMQTVLQHMEASPLLALLVGAVFTAVIQSSSATTLIAMGLLNAGTLSLAAGIAVMLGANVGTCATALIASVGSGRAARWTAYTHALFNAIGALAFLPLIQPFSTWAGAKAMTPGAALAHASVLFNVISALLALPFSSAYGRWVEQRLAGKK